MAGIFISYAHEDQAAAKRIVDALAREGLDAWWDHEIPPGRSWDEVIGARIGSAKVTIVIWSRRSVGSDFVKEEAQIALEAGKLVPVRVDDIDPPVGFRRTHAANLIGWRGETSHPQWRLVLDEVRARLGGATVAKPMRRQSSYRGNSGGGFLGGVVAALALTLVLGGGWYAYNSGLLAPRSGETVQSAVTDEASDTTEAPPPSAPPQEANARAAEQPTPAPATSIASVSGSVWRGQIRLPNGAIPLGLRFNSDATVDMQMDRDTSLRRTTNTWRQSGERVTIVSERTTMALTLSGDQMSGVMAGGLATLTPDTASSASAPMQTPSIVGTWRGSVNGPNVHAAAFRFGNDGIAEILTTPNGQWTGSRNHWAWRQDGATVQLTFYYDTVARRQRPGAVLNGVIEGDVWSGTYTHDGQSYPFNYRRQ